jgi:lantibiotic modifying enzyme
VVFPSIAAHTNLAIRGLPPRDEGRWEGALVASVEHQQCGQSRRASRCVPGAGDRANGAAGIAYGLYQIACARGDAALLSQADVWMCWAERAVDSPDAFHIPEAELPPEWFSTVTPFHQASGIHLVRALISQALGDLSGMQAAIDAFVAAAKAPCSNPDLTLGRAGVLLGCAMLMEALPDTAMVDGTAMKALGDEAMEALWTGNCAVPHDYLGMAHGVAGILYATLRYHQITRCPLPLGAEEALSRLEAEARQSGRGSSWPLQPRSQEEASGWCHGSAGYVWLWTLAHRVSGQESYLDLAKRAGLHVWEHPAGGGTLCCGMAGQAYAMLHLYRHTGEEAWLQRAYDLAEAAAASIRESGERRDSIYKGEVGVALLAIDLEDPPNARFPMFEAEGWLE